MKNVCVTYKIPVLCKSVPKSGGGEAGTNYRVPGPNYIAYVFLFLVV
jgi:hypothetical protein